jgi:hypothetical protein
MTTTNATTMLRTAPIQRPLYAATVTGGTDERMWKRLMKQWYGLTPAHGDNWDGWAECPHRLVKQRCESSTSGGYCRWVREGDWHRLPWDHARAWRNSDGELVITLEPWGNPFDIADTFAALKRHLDDLGVAVSFEGRSPYGASYILFLMSADTDLGQRAKVISRIAENRPRRHDHHPAAIRARGDRRRRLI